MDVIRSKDTRSASNSTQGSSQVESQLGVSPTSTASSGSQRTVEKGGKCSSHFFGKGAEMILFSIHHN